MADVTKVKIVPMNATWGIDTAMVQTITCSADVADSLDGKHGFIYTALNAIKYHFWFNTSGGAATDPAPAGSTAQVVALTTGASASAVATALASALDGLAGFIATASGPVVTVTNAAIGYASQAHEGNASGCAFAVTTYGDSALDLGLLSGTISFTPKLETTPITAEQYGKTVLGEIITGRNLEVMITMLEGDTTAINRMIRVAGGSFTPAGGTEVNGWGVNKLFESTVANASKLVLHPVALGAADKTQDYTFHLAYPQIDKLEFSGEKIFDLPLKFTVYPKFTLNGNASYFCRGDGSQTLT